MISNVILIFVLLLGISLAGILSGAETAVYQMSRLRLRIGIENKKPLFIMLGAVMHDGPSLLTSMLIGTNLVQYIITSIVTYLLLERIQDEKNVELFATLLTAPGLFVFTELIPKNIFFHRADTLLPYTAPVLFFFKKIFTLTGIVPLLKIISRAPTDTSGSVMRQPYIKAIVQDTHEESFLSPVQTEMINRLAGIANLSITAVMTRMETVQALDINSNRSGVLEQLKTSPFTRPLVYKASADNIVGFLNIYECLCRPEDFDNLTDFVKPIKKIPARTTIIDAINIMRSQADKIVLVVRPGRAGRERPLGIVTIKDLVEEVLGELVEW